MDGGDDARIFFFFFFCVKGGGGTTVTLLGFTVNLRFRLCSGMTRPAATATTEVFKEL